MHLGPLVGERESGGDHSAVNGELDESMSNLSFVKLLLLLGCGKGRHYLCNRKELFHGSQKVSLEVRGKAKCS